MSPLLLAIIFSFLLILATTLFRFKPGRKLPPGPRGLPVIGHLHMLGQLPHKTLHRLAQKHGPIMSIRLGLKPAIIISSSRAAELFLKTHDTNFASRPKTEASEVISYGSKGMVFTEYGPYWRSVRKLCILELLSPSKIEEFKGMRKAEMGKLVGRLRKANGTVVDLGDEVARVTEDMSCKMVFGKCSDEKFDLKGPVKEVLELVGAFNITDFLPFLGPLDLQGLTRRLKATSKKLDRVLEIIIDQHEHDANGTERHQNDFIDVMLSLKNKSSGTPNESPYMIQRDNVKAVVLNMIVASLESSSVSIEWTMSELLRNPKVMRKVQDELNNVIGKDKMVEEADLTKLEYLNMVIKESLRLHPVAPFLIPRKCIDDITIDGYFIPKNSRIMVNTWTIGRDAEMWTNNSEEFIPERFIGSEIDVKGKHFHLIPFGSGRRGCPGINLGMTSIRLVLAHLVHCFDWELPKGTSPTELDMSEKFGLSLARANNLLATPTYRLHDSSLDIFC